MSDADWDADDFEPADPDGDKAKVVATDKWEGEDEEEDVKDNWDEDDSEKKDTPTEGKAVQVKKKKPLKERIAEKEAKRLEEAKKRLENDDSDSEDAEEGTPEGIAAAKERARRAQEESDLQLAKEAFGIEGVKGDSIDSANPVTKEDFDKFSECLKEKLQHYEKSTHYVGFLDNLFRDLSLSLEVDDVKKISATLTALSNEKIKQQKAAKNKKKKKGVNLQVSRGDGLDDYEAAAYDGFDDFI